MIAFRRSISKLALSWTIVVAATGNATPVVYTLQTVADGKLGSHVFAEALVTIQMKADTRTVHKQPSSNGGFLYTNSTGVATVSVNDGGRTTIATFAPGEVYVRYDSGTGIAGFGSAISPSYPIALDCDNSAYPSEATYVQDCLQPDWPSSVSYKNGTASALADPEGAVSDGYLFSAELLSLPQNLSQSTLLTGRVHSCATTYTIGPSLGGTGDLQVCAGPAKRGLNTDHGGFFLQDQVGGSNPMNSNPAAAAAPNGWLGWEVANTGALQVEVIMTE